MRAVMLLSLESSSGGNREEEMGRGRVRGKRRDLRSKMGLYGDQKWERSSRAWRVCPLLWCELGNRWKEQHFWVETRAGTSRIKPSRGFMVNKRKSVHAEGKKAEGS